MATPSKFMSMQTRLDDAVRYIFWAQTESDYADWYRYPHKDMKECVQLAVGCFGKERVMWGTGCM